MHHETTFLGIETSCDETAAAVVRADGTILSNIILSQFEEHQPFGGVVPEIAARAHAEHLDDVINAALKDAGLGLEGIDAIAVTAGPGLIGGVIVGVVTAKAIALARDLPIYAINHLEGHALSARLSSAVQFPYLLLLVSGGHCQLLIVRGVGQYERLGTTIDDAAGEAFDKAAKFLGLGVPGGPRVEDAALKGDDTRFNLPRPLTDRDNMDFSFSGLKTALQREAVKIGPADLSTQDTADLCAGLQAAISDCLIDRSQRAMTCFRDQLHAELKDLDNLPEFVVAGGVAANTRIRSDLQALCDAEGFRFHAPPHKLCTDNAAMIAWAGLEHHAAGTQPDAIFKARPRWPLDEEAAPRVGFGKKGAKA